MSRERRYRQELKKQQCQQSQKQVEYIGLRVSYEDPLFQHILKQDLRLIKILLDYLTLLLIIILVFLKHTNS